jgi:thioesterase domain-containing protein
VNPTITLSDLLLHPTVKGLLESKREESIFHHLECIVRLNEGKNKKNIFLVHPRHGMVYQYKELGKLLEKDFNVYGIQARGLLKKSKLPQDFELAAADYLKQMRQVQAEGPYIIGAFCIGDMIGYNMVRQLEEQNQTVEKFIMFDEFAFLPPNVSNYYRQNIIIDSVLKPLKKTFKRNSKENLEFEKMLEEIEKDGAKNKYERNFGVLIGNYIKLSPYKRIQGIIKAPILNIKAEESFMEIVQKNICKMTLGKVEFDSIPGQHDTMFQYPYVTELAEVIRRSFDNNGNIDNKNEKPKIKNEKPKTDNQ